MSVCPVPLQSVWRATTHTHTQAQTANAHSFSLVVRCESIFDAFTAFCLLFAAAAEISRQSSPFSSSFLIVLMCCLLFKWFLINYKYTHVYCRGLLLPLFAPLYTETHQVFS
jgi:hypothetical protein